MRIAFIAIVIACIAAPASATTLHVDSTAAPGGNGQTWPTAFDDLQDALDAARSDPAVDAIHVAAGTYFADRGTLDPNVSFELVDGVSLLGGFPVGGGPFADRDPATNPTILAGDLLGDDQPPDQWGLLSGLIDNTHHLVDATNCGPATILDGFTLRGGHTDSGDPAGRSGGALRIQGGNPTIQYCRFERSRASWGGGGIAAIDATPLIAECVFVENVGDSFGGGLAILGTVDATIHACTFINNRGGNGVGAYCGPLHPFSGMGNATTIDACLFTENDGVIGATAGGGLGLWRGANTVRDCVFIDNRANGGGGVHVGQGGATIERCTFIGNNGDGDGGGAIGVQDFSAPQPLDTTIISCLLAGNNGGVIATNSDVEMINCTVVRNQLPDTPIFLTWPALLTQDANFELRNCIVWDNPDLDFWGGVRDFLAGDPLYTVHDSIIQDWDGTLPGSALDVYPLFFDPSGPDGDPELVHDNNYRLRSDSPALDSGLDAALPPGATRDVDGNARFVDADGDGLATVDISAFERCPIDLNADGVGDVADAAALFDALLGPDLASHVGDIDADGDSDLHDAALLQRWLPGGCE
jgi:hypothetical protein